MSAASMSTAGYAWASRIARQPEPVQRSRALVDRLRGTDIRCEAIRQELGDERPRDKHALVDVEAELAEPRLLREIGRRNAPVDAPLEELGDLRALGLRQARVEERIEAIERQVQRMQQQVGRLVVGIGRAVAERERCLAEARHGVPKPVAQRLEVVRGGAHEWCAPTLATSLDSVAALPPVGEQ